MNNFQVKVIRKAMENDHKLSPWECDFIVSLSERSDNYELSDKQNKLLNRISAKVY